MERGREGECNLPRHKEIQNAYQAIGGEHTFYDGMATCTTLAGKAVCKLVWGMNPEENNHYLQLACKESLQIFRERCWKYPVGTGILTMPVYASLYSKQKSLVWIILLK